MRCSGRDTVIETRVNEHNCNVISVRIEHTCRSILRSQCYHPAAICCHQTRPIRWSSTTLRGQMHCNRAMRSTSIAINQSWRLALQNHVAVEELRQQGQRGTRAASTCQVQYEGSQQLQIAVVVVKDELNPRSLARGDRDIKPHLMHIHRRRIVGLCFRVRIQTKLWALVHWGACDQHRKVGAFGAGISTGVTVVQRYRGHSHAVVQRGCELRDRVLAR